MRAKILKRSIWWYRISRELVLVTIYDRAYCELLPKFIVVSEKLEEFQIQRFAII